MTLKHPPRLLQSGLTGRVYITTRYTEHENGAIVSSVKYDVTKDFEAIEDERGAEYLAMVEGQRARALAEVVKLETERDTALAEVERVTLAALEALTAIERVKALHRPRRQPTYATGTVCDYDCCLWPCHTIEALDQP